MLPIRRILHPTDFSDQSRPAFEVACALAHDYRAEVVVCHVAPHPVPAVAEGVMVDVPESPVEDAAALLAAVEPPDPHVRLVRRLRQGDAADEIVKAAAEGDFDLIVMGTHGRGGLARLVLGSVAERVLRAAACPVLTVKAPFRREHERPMFVAAGELVWSD
jgi:nucleotide-binding universal stress UspA family protein